MPNVPTRGIVSPRSSGERIQAHSFEPPEDLSDIIERFWAADWDLPEDEPHTTLLLGDPCVHIVFEDGPRGLEARVVGVWTQLWKRKLEGRGKVRGIKFHPGAAGAILPRPIEQWSDKITALDEVLHNVSSLSPLALNQDLEQAFEALRTFLRERRNDSDAAPEVQRMVTLVKDNQGITRVEMLADAFNLSPRALQRLFKENLGASPKWLIRRFRLQEVATRIEQGTEVSFASLAAELGYTDQAHLAREFKNAVGKSPSEFAMQSKVPWSHQGEETTGTK